MTHKEAISKLVNAEYADRFQGDEDLTTANLMAVRALRDKEFFRWHDLIADKRDLPNDGEIVEIWYEYYHYKAEAVLPEYGHGKYFSDMKLWGGDAGNGRKLRVLKWRYIEPFGEEEREDDDSK